jgi:hypothetical protein
MKIVLKSLGVAIIAIGIGVAIGTYSADMHSVKPIAVPATIVTATSITQSESVETASLTSKPTILGVAPETEAALNQFGLSAKSIFKLGVSAKLKNPITVK